MQKSLGYQTIPHTWVKGYTGRSKKLHKQQGRPNQDFYGFSALKVTVHVGSYFLCFQTVMSVKLVQNLASTSPPPHIMQLH